ncbi:hypothetical protein CPEBRM1_ABPJDJAI_01322 [Companilactobacillus paralimentarius]|uniref:histidine phosphatase family protein n=1 Tax=Companilactobacillus paralimentarius TaxID=83526 RepID=UPI00384AE150
MKVYLIRHSETDFSQVDSHHYVGYGRDLSRITPNGIKIAQNAARNPIFNEIQLLLISPYTRTMETTLEIIKQHPTIPTQVELLLHEWRPDKPGRKLENYNQLKQIHKDYLNGTHSSGFDYETGPEIIERVSSVLNKYKDKYDCIGCATHGQVIRWMTGMDMASSMPYCGIYQLDYK